MPVTLGSESALHFSTQEWAPPARRRHMRLILGISCKADSVSHVYVMFKAEHEMPVMSIC
jgi:hypothetical protein